MKPKQDRQLPLPLSGGDGDSKSADQPVARPEHADEIGSSPADESDLSPVRQAAEIRPMVSGASTQSSTAEQSWGPSKSAHSAAPAAGSASSATHRSRTWLPEILLAAAALLVLGLWIGRAPLLDPDEARYASASRSMLERGDLVVPYFNGAERLNKPALFYWFQTASFRVLGATEAAARLPSVCAALATLLIVYSFARRRFGREAAICSGAILLTCPLFAVVGKSGITDMTLCLFITTALVLWHRLYSAEGSAAESRLSWLGVSLALGLAFFVKGPVGVIVPCLVIALFLIVRGEWNRFRARSIAGGAAVAAAVFLPWALLLVYRLGVDIAPDGGSFIIVREGLARVSELLRRETIERTVSGLDHPQPIYYYLPVALLVCFPWSVFVPFALARRFAELRRREPDTLFLIVWLLTVPVFFSLVKGKLVTYILPAAPPLALLLGREWARLRGGAGVSAPLAAAAPRLAVTAPIGNAPASPSTAPTANPSGRWWAVAGTIALAVASVGACIYMGTSRAEWLVDHRVQAVSLGLLMLAAAIVPLALRRIDLGVFAIAAAMGITLLAVPSLAGREIASNRSERDLVAEAGIADGPWTRVLAYQLSRPSLVFYGHRTVEVLSSPRQLREHLDAGSLVVIEEKRFRAFEPIWQDTFRTVAAHNRLLAIAPVGPIPASGPDVAIRTPKGDGR